jgi:transposase InsO family protein
MSMNPQERIARHRLSVLELAEALQNVRAACRRRGMTRTQFYDYQRRFELQGLDGLKDLPPIHKRHPQTTPPETVERIVALSLAHPAWGCCRLEAHLKLDGVSVSSPTIPSILMSILIKHEMGTKLHRLFKLEERAAATGFELTAEQVRAVERANPCFRERHIESSRPGELLAADTFFVGSFKGVGKVYLHTVVDTFGSYAFGFLHTSKLPAAAVSTLHNDALPFYAERHIPVAALLTDTGREFCGTPAHPFEVYLALNGIEHRRTKVRSPKTNGFVERFQRTAKEEFFELALRETFYESVEALQTDFDAWLRLYNTERPHLGYRNRGKRPIDTVNAYLSVMDEAS